MQNKKSFLKILAINLMILILLIAGFSLNLDAQVSSSDQLFHSSIFTPPNSFTHDVEGPAVDRHGTVYAVNFAREGTIGKMTPTGKASLFIELPDGSIGNGIRFDSHGDMLIADYAKHHVFRINMKTKKITVVAYNSGMNEPNDLAIDSKGHIYASDPNFKKNTGRVWRIDHGKMTLLDSLGPANGIEVSPDEKTLYVNAYQKVWAYDLAPDGSVSNKHLLIQFTQFGTDGMRCDIKGNLYIARIGKGTVAKISPQGKLIREIKLIGKKPTNVAFGGKDGRTIYVTLMDQGNLESFRVDTPGRAWKMQRR